MTATHVASLVVNLDPVNAKNSAPKDYADAAKARANHTGTQLASTISDFSSAADARVAAAVGVSVQALSSNLTAFAAKTAPTGAVVGTTDSQSLSNKDLTGGSNTFPVFNQNTTGNAATATKLATARNIAGVAFDGTANISLGSTTPTASTLAQWDANKNLSANSHFAAFTTTATAAGTTTLTITSTPIQVFTGSTTQTVLLPTTSVPTGAQVIVLNASTGAVTVQSSAGNTITVLAAGTSAIFTALVATPTTAANWSSQYLALKAASGKSLTVNNSLTLVGTDGTTLTFPGSSDTIAGLAATQAFTNKDLTGAGNTFPTFNQNTTGTAAAITGKTNPTGAFVGTTDTQALTNKDLTGAGNTFPTLNQNTTGTAAGVTGKTTPTGAFVGTTDTQTLTNKTIDASSNTVTNLTTTAIAAATLVTASETIGSNNNDTTIPTSAAVKAYADSLTGGAIAGNNGGRYTTTIGDGSTTSIVVTHNLGTRDVEISVYDATTFEEVYPDKFHTSANTATIVFGTAPATNAYNVVVTLGGGWSSFASTATAAGTTTLTINSQVIQLFTGSTTQTVVLPTTSVPAGYTFKIINTSTGALTVNASGGALVDTVPASTMAVFTALQAAPTLPAHWGVLGNFPTNGSFPTLNQNTTGNAATATKLATARAINGVNFDGSAAITIVPRAVSPAVAGTYTIDVTVTDLYVIGTQNAAITNLTTTGTLADGQKIFIRIKSDATPRAITWDSAKIVSSGVASLPSITVASKTILVGLIADATLGKLVCVAVDAVGY